VVVIGEQSVVCFPPLFLSLSEYSIGCVTLILNIYSYLLVHCMSLLFGSWLVFISEMSTLSDGSWAELSMSMWWWIFEYPLVVIGGFGCATIGF